MKTAAVRAPVQPASSPLASLIALAALKKGEQFGGLVHEEDAWHIVVLLPGELKPSGWKVAQEWAKKQGGELPTRREQSLLYANLKDEFKADWYWSGEQHGSASGYAWCQDFDGGTQYDDDAGDELRARAVRRLKI